MVTESWEKAARVEHESAECGEEAVGTAEATGQAKGAERGGVVMGPWSTEYAGLDHVGHARPDKRRSPAKGKSDPDLRRAGVMDIGTCSTPRGKTTTLEVFLGSGSRIRSCPQSLEALSSRTSPISILWNWLAGREDRKRLRLIDYTEKKRDGIECMSRTPCSAAKSKVMKSLICQGSSTKACNTVCRLMLSGESVEVV
ncbi:hypothetical protein Micbo1qcDRAFT_62086 [Microdochium bolleyi]|uniref:Uncharacterized protein n=1 Tax=Microdochium bolleyi TaxID=196109 RepID=A0A136J5G9_9PEZI|nr:hypothetical protein Micbo1qcDRAFT_62086 [Microdochium bolleyi]